MGLFEGLLGRHIDDDGDSRRKDDMAATDASSHYAIPPLSPTAASVVHRCARIAGVPVEELLRRFEPERAEQPLIYARSLVEYCSYIALRVETKRHDHLGDREFHSLTYDMMLAWEAPDEETDAEFQMMTMVDPYSTRAPRKWPFRLMVGGQLDLRHLPRLLLPALPWHTRSPFVTYSMRSPILPEAGCIFLSTTST